ncbi:DUF2336 domain-containing protein [Microvirga sp. 2YAF29]|uniref:DUF2336 domain-containing protein n=1 Tax=Microvirga sp. 2YAF29 TaxID=3233031 RepID=UPI003F9E9AAD
MVSSANPDLWSELGQPDLDETEACVALLKLNAEMFVAAPARDRDSIETFEALALGLLPKADHATLLDIARILGSCEDTPQSVRDTLSRMSADARVVLQRHAASKFNAADEKLLASMGGRLQLALRPGLDTTMAERILVLREAASEDALAANPAFNPALPAFATLVSRATDRPALAEILLAREDLSLLHEAQLYLTANDARRAHIRERVADAVAGRKATITFTTARHDADALLDAARCGDAARIEALLTASFGFPEQTQWRVLKLGRHRLLPLALKALDVPRREAIAIFLTLHPALSHPLSAIRTMVHEMRDASGPVALALIEAILGVRALSGKSVL